MTWWWLPRIAACGLGAALWLTPAAVPESDIRVTPVVADGQVRVLHRTGGGRSGDARAGAERPADDADLRHRPEAAVGCVVGPDGSRRWPSRRR